MKLSETAIHRPVLTSMVFTALVVFGLIAQRTIPMALYPDVDMPIVTVTVVYEGASPESVESEVTEVVEEALSSISGIKSMRSETSEGVTQIFLEFELNRNVDVAAQDVRDKIAAIRSELPLDSEPPVIEKFDPDDAPILSIVLSGQSSIRELSRYADDVIKPRLESIGGVGGVQLAGDREREVRIWLRVDDLIAYNLAAQDVVETLRKENVEFPGGRIESDKRELIVKTRGRVENVPDFKNLIVRQNGPNLVRLHQVAYVEDGIEDQRSLARLNGQPAVSISVRQQSGTNMVAIANQALAELDKIRANLPAGHDLLVVQDLSHFVKQSVNEAQSELLRGGTLAILVILFFLRSFRGAFVAAVTIPATIISTYAFMLAMGFSMNTLTLLALTICVGMIIDDSIVVLENTYRHMQAGLKPFPAAVAAMDEIGFAVIATSLSIAAVFVPVAFMDSMVGKFFYEFGMTVTFAVIVSTMIALTLSPMLCARVLVDPQRSGGTPRRTNLLGRMDGKLEAFFVGIEQRYGQVLSFAVRRRFTVILLSLAVLAASVLLVPLIGKEFMPVPDEGQFIVVFEAPVGSSIGQTSAIASELESRLAELPSVSDVYTTIGGQYDGIVTVAQIVVQMVNKAERRLSQEQLMVIARERLADFSHLRLSVDVVNRVGGGGFRSAPIQYNLRGDDLDQLEELADKMVAKLRATPGFVDVNSTSQSGKPEIAIDIDRDRAADLGVKVEDLGRAVSSLIGGQVVSTFESDGKNVDVRLRLVGDQRARAEALRSLPVRRRDGQLTQLQNMASIRQTFGPTSIERQSRRRQVTVLANLEPSKPLGEAVQDIGRFESQLGLPEGVVSVFTGSAEMMAETFASIVFCLFLAIVLTYMILAAQFESFVHPLTIMLSLPLSVGGALGALWISGLTLNMFSMIGMVMLMGLVTKNAILLVDYTNFLRRQGMSRDAALLQAGPVRLRPILMTAISTIAGMLPVAFGFGDGAESRAPMGACVVGGMVTSTLLTLVVIPVVYSLLDDIRGWIPAILRWLAGRRPPVVNTAAAADAPAPLAASADLAVPAKHHKS
jgi:HAE1 family hydrophobic/amphiphilic exporter-1